jgi:hypothetical protein
LAAISGCSFHRTDHGFIVRSGPWTLERNREPPEVSPQVVADKPEVLPWRSRLKGYRLGARIFPGHESVDETSTAATTSNELKIPESVSSPIDVRRPDLVVD